MDRGCVRAVARERRSACSALCVAALLAFAVGGCSATGPSASLQGARDTTIAFESIDGPPPAVFRKLVQKLNEEAEARQVPVTTREGFAPYRVRAYVAVGVDGMDRSAEGKTPPEGDWAILRLAQPITNIKPIPVEAMPLEEIDRRIAAGEVMSNLGYGLYGIGISRRLHRTDDCMLVTNWREHSKKIGGGVMITTCPGIQGDSGGPVLITDQAENRRLVGVLIRANHQASDPTTMAVNATVFIQKL